MSRSNTLDHLNNPSPQTLGRSPLEWLDRLQRPTVVRVAGRDSSRTRAMATLLHGNEPSGLFAVHRWLLEQHTPEVLPYSQACENNKAPILEKLREIFNAPGTVVEIGTGTGQHAEHFAATLPHLQWQPTDHPRAAHLAVARLQQAALPNVLPILELDVNQMPWPVSACRWAFSANTAHIMAWEEVEKMFQGVGACLQKDGAFCLYGPFKHKGGYTSESNKAFDQSLKSQAPHMGIRDIEALSELAKAVGLQLQDDVAMPANNELLVFVRGICEP